MTVAYANRTDVYRVGLPRGSVVEPARLVSSVDVTLDRFELEGHGLQAGDPVQFQIDAGSVLPAPLVLLTVYYALAVPLSDGSPSENLFQVSATNGGAAVNVTDVGVGTFRAFVPIGVSIDRECEQHSRWIDSLLPSQQAPLVAPYPSWVTATVAKRAAASLVRQLGLGGLEGIVQEAADVTLDAMRMAKNGIALRGDAAAQVPTQLATSGPVLLGRFADDSPDGAIP